MDLLELIPSLCKNTINIIKEYAVNTHFKDENIKNFKDIFKLLNKRDHTYGLIIRYRDPYFNVYISPNFTLSAVILKIIKSINNHIQFEYRSLYNHNNRIVKNNKSYYKCKCGSFFNRSWFSKHINTKKHKKNIINSYRIKPLYDFF